MKSGNELVTVCVPTRDRLRFLRQSLATILAQDHPQIEIVISDNWSSDGTEDYCRTLADKERVRYIRPPSPVGLYANHNFVLGQARGEFVCFFHDDDLYRPTIVSTYVDYFRKHHGVGAVCSDWERIDQHGDVISRRLHRVPDVMPGVEYIDRTLRSGRSHLALSGSMFRRIALPDAPFDESGPLGFSDIAAWFRLAEQWEIGHVHETLWSYRQHSGALSQRRPSDIASDYEVALGRFVEDYSRRRPEAQTRVSRWRAAIRRYCFWARLYELIYQHMPEGAGADARMPVQPLTVEELRVLHRDLDRCASSLQRALLRFLRFAIRKGWTWPLSAMIRYSSLARQFLRMA